MVPQQMVYMVYLILHIKKVVCKLELSGIRSKIETIETNTKIGVIHYAEPRAKV